MKNSIALLAFCVLLHANLGAQTISEKKAASLKMGEDVGGGTQLQVLNHALVSLRSSLDLCYARVAELHARGAEEREFRALLEEVNGIKAHIVQLENEWRLSAVGEAKKDEEGYALWDQEETTLAQLIMEYGAMDFLYVVPPEMAGMKLHMHSAVPIPRESWSEVLEIILAHNGVGVKKLNPYTRQLFIFKQDPSAVQNIAARPEELLFVPNGARLFYVLSPPIEQIKSTFQFFERFSDAKQTFIYQVGSKIALVSSKEEVEKLLALYNTVWQDPKGKVSKVVPVTKMSVKEMEKILQSFFGESIEKNRAPFGKIEQDGLTIMALGQGSLVLIGQQESVERAEKIVRDTEAQLQDPSEMTVFLYTCRHSDPADLAAMLEKVYVSLLSVLPDAGRETVEVSHTTQPGTRPPDGFPQVPPLIVTPPALKPGSISETEIVESSSDHFIPDPKTGNLLMVVRRDALTKIKDLLRKLDIPKKMVQIEVLLFEKKLDQESKFGLNLLRLGSKKNGMLYTGLNAPEKGGAGVLAFFFHGAGSKYLPAFDLAYNFLMAQEDVQLNAAPSVITVNQTPATISIVEEISLNNGAAPVNTSSGQIAFQDTYSRAQYGITIVLTPIIHAPEEGDEGKGFVTLQTNVTFDMPRPSANSGRPNVDRRHIENEVRVADGETVILGGLRRKSRRDKEDRVPFLGEIPGIGKLFGATELTDSSSEIIFFITPKIILDSKEELERIRTEELKKRPGDIPEFLECLIRAQNCERRCYFRKSMRWMLGGDHG
jgi:general secretion pathway protein D